ncbi:hypothetical protein [Candidatus Berkiella aquae]|uniref:Uncharacterized protein n=1 Tax=Candidatus Berkiella aquae TaxID=295108 RepID=A0A0Q9YP20_9GAMM|nr:hypothetical protein [Candidatus Berkiella aquae]MCS5712080.1 hypothetical protein [Candidatus Berkiella aquae]
MLDTPLAPLNNHLEIDINWVNQLIEMQVPSVEIINQILNKIELSFVQYAKKNKETYFRLLRSAKPIKIKKALLFKLIDTTLHDINHVLALQSIWAKLLIGREVTNSTNLRFDETYKPLIDLINDILHEVIRINAYGNDIKDLLRYQLSALHGSVGHLNYFSKNYEKMADHFYNKFILIDAIEDNEIKEKSFHVSDFFAIAKAFLNTNDLHAAAGILRLERERFISEGSKMYHYCCKRLATQFASQKAYPQAIAWHKEAMHIQESSDSTILINHLVKENLEQINRYLETIPRKSCIMASCESTSKRMTAEHQVVIDVAIPEWSPKLITRLKQLTGKFAFEFEPEKLIVHKLSSVGVNNLAEIVDSINKLEKEYQSHLGRQLEKTIKDLQTSIETLTMTKPVVEIVPVSSSSSMRPSCSTDPVPACRIKKTPKTKTRGKPQTKRQIIPQASSSVPTCHAEKYGFSRALFGMHTFQECRIRGDNQRVFYVVKSKIEASNRRGDNHHLFDSLIAEPKIVSPCGEEGFKWMKVGERQVLVGKILSTKKRLFPTLTQRNAQGAIAFLYGNIVNTKNGFSTYDVKHYAPPPKKKP